MSGELDTRPDLVEQIRVLRDRLDELERRVSGDEQGFDLSDLNDVRVDSMVDAGVTLVNGSALVYRASDDIWIAGTASASLITNSYYEFLDDGTTTGLAYTAGNTENKWSAVGGFSNGSDVTLVSGRVTIATTGIYSIAATWLLTADTAADTFSHARGRFTLNRTNEPGSPVHDQAFLDDWKQPTVAPSTNKHTASFMVGVTAFMYAGDDVRCESIFSAASAPGSTWSVQTASMYVERFA